MQKIFNPKSFNYLVWTPLGSIVNLKKHFCLQVHFKVSAAWYCSHYLPPVAAGVVDTGGNLPPVVSLIPAANLPPVSTTLAKLVAKFVVGVADTGGAPLLANISANFRKNSKRS
jgi:hypothetical protein